MKPEEILTKALETLRQGGTILYPTDTVWGLGCDATNAAAVARIFEIKQRADSKSLVLLASDLDMVAKYVKQVPEMAVELVEVNDAPMTIIYRMPSRPKPATSGTWPPLWWPRTAPWASAFPLPTGAASWSSSWDGPS